MVPWLRPPPPQRAYIFNVRESAVKTPSKKGRSLVRTQIVLTSRIEDVKGVDLNFQTGVLLLLIAGVVAMLTRGCACLTALAWWRQGSFSPSCRTRRKSVSPKISYLPLCSPAPF